MRKNSSLRHSSLPPLIDIVRIINCVAALLFQVVLTIALSSSTLFDVKFCPQHLIRQHILILCFQNSFSKP